MANSSEALSQSVYDEIVRQIMARELLPGDRVPEKKIADAFGISRSPVRDALRRLESEGLIEVFPNRFAQVTQLRPDELRELGVLRVSLDAMSVKLALLFGSRSEFLALRSLAESCDTSAAGSDFYPRVLGDTQFHLSLVELGRNPMLIKFQKALNTRVQFAILHYPNEIKYTSAPMHDHIAIADALLEGDERLALKVSVDHLIRFYDLAEHYPPDFFDYLKK